MSGAGWSWRAVRYAAVGDVVRYGIIGSGMMGLEHLRNLQLLDGAEVTAIADPHPASREWAMAVAGMAGDTLTTFESHTELVDSGLCDAVVIATPNMTHAAVLDDLLPTDLHILVEKPLCTTVADCRRIVEASAGREALVWVGLEYRYMPPVARLIREVHAGAAGRVRMVSIREHRFPFLPKVGDWNRFSRNTGGTLVEKCCHFFDLMNHITGATPVRVLASGAQDVNHLDEVYDGEVPDILDNAFVIVDYADASRALLDLCMFAEGSAHQEELSVVGDLGKVEAFLPSAEVRIGTRAGGRDGVVTEVVHDDRVAYEGFHHGSSYLEHLDFLAAIRRGGAPDVGPADGLLSVAMGVAAHRSIEEGRAVDLAEVLDDPDA
jgi:myo-inositol 2-dehydrogenase/D-chiro-inositol 1-dehydrogenase